jgi:hypothetical protein
MPLNAAGVAGLLLALMTGAVIGCPGESRSVRPVSPDCEGAQFAPFLTGGTTSVREVPLASGGLTLFRDGRLRSTRGLSARSDCVKGRGDGPSEGQFDHAYVFLRPGGAQLIVSQVSTIMSSWSCAELITPEGGSAWAAIRFPSNTGAPLLCGDSLFVTGSGFVGSFDIGTGEKRWAMDQLDRKSPGHYNAFGPIVMNGRILRLQERGSASKVDSPVGSITLDAETGRILKGDYLDGK